MTTIHCRCCRKNPVKNAAVVCFACLAAAGPMITPIEHHQGVPMHTVTAAALIAERGEGLHIPELPLPEHVLAARNGGTAVTVPNGLGPELPYAGGAVPTIRA
jgi:hypothetical protein